MYQYSDTEKQAHSPSIFPLLNCHWVTSAETHTAAITVLIFQTNGEARCTVANEDSAWAGLRTKLGHRLGQNTLRMAEILRRALSWGSSAGPGPESAAEVGPPLLLLGGPGSGKTALLFAAALEAAGEDRGAVLFLTRAPLQSLPRGTGARLDHLRLQKIRFQYPRSTRELHRLLCSAHETPGPAPSLLLLDGLEKYLMEDLGTQGTAHLAALLLDTAAHFSHRAGPGRGCGLIVTLQTQEEGYSGDVLQLLLLQRYFPAQCWLHLEGPGPGPQRLQICLEPGGLGSRAEWWMSFQQDGEMTITSCATQTCNPSSEKSSSSGGQS